MTKKPRGFQLLTPERHREVASAGGRAVPDHKRGFYRNPELASEAGRKGGLARQKKANA